MCLCINPYCGTIEHNNPDTATSCEKCGCELQVNEKYTVKRLLSNKSGFSTVYEIEDEAKQTKVLKVLQSRFNEEPRTVALFQQEVYLLQQIESLTLPKIDDYIHHQLSDGQILHGILMEKIEGSNLKEWMQARDNQPISQEMAIAWMRKIVTALNLVHQQNYFHRDIKPSNIMLEPSGRLLLIDFGSARHESFTYLDKLNAGGGITQITSAGYTAPEQERGFALPQSDFYSLGMTFINLLTGKCPLNMYDPRADVYNWREFAPQINSALADLLDSLIATKPIERPSNCAIILETLEKISAPTRSTAIAASPARIWRKPLRIALALAIPSLVAYAIAANYQLLPLQKSPATSQVNS